MATSNLKTAMSPDPESPLTPSTPLASSRSTALSTRITSVLSASYSDLEIRDALSILDKSAFKNTSEARRTVRLAIQEDVLKRNGQILDDFAGVADELRRVDRLLSNLQRTCGLMRATISAANTTTAPVRDEARALLDQKQAVETRQTLLAAFQQHFTLTEDEASALTDATDPTSDAFFAALTKLKRIHADSQVLLSSSSERLGLSILEGSSKTLNSAYQTLFRWTQRSFKALDLENPRLSAGIRRALRVLAERPTLFAGCLDNFAAAREGMLETSFGAALTGSGAGDEIVGKPIEFQAHDPLRYISDMLAWVHSATVSEREALEVLFIGEGEELAKGIQEGLDNDIFRRSETAPVFDGKKALNQLVSRDIAGVARTLRQRTEQVINSQEEATVAYRIANLLAFYSATFKKLLGPDAEVLSILSLLESSAQRQFRTNMQDAVQLMQPDLAATPASASMPEFMGEALETLRALLNSYDTSLAVVISAQSPSTNAEEEGFAPVLKSALDPFLDGCDSLSAKLEPPQSDVLITNALLETVNILLPYSFTNAKVDALNDRIDNHSASLIKHQHAFFIDTSGLEPLVSALSPIPASDLEALKALPVLQDADQLLEWSQTLDGFLPSALMDALDNLSSLVSKKLAREVTEAAAEKFCVDFEMVESKFAAIDEVTIEELGPESDNDEEDEDRDPLLRELFPRTSAEIRVLLS
jgi:hypothetical protein